VQLGAHRAGQLKLLDAIRDVGDRPVFGHRDALREHDGLRGRDLRAAVGDDDRADDAPGEDRPDHHRRRDPHPHEPPDRDHEQARVELEAQAAGGIAVERERQRERL
jgi:hypothetical protein